MSLLDHVGYSLSVSSVLEDDEERFGAGRAVDGSDSTCWTSDGRGTPQSITLHFESPVVVRAVLITFQGGYSGQNIDVHVQLAASAAVSDEGASTEKWRALSTGVFIDDSNAEETVLVPAQGPVTAVKLVFNTSADLFGRVSVYHLRVDGDALDALP